MKGRLNSMKNASQSYNEAQHLRTKTIFKFQFEHLIYIIKIVFNYMSSTDSNNNITKKPKQVTSSSKKKYQFIWKTFFIFILIIASILFSKVYVFQTHQYFKDIRKGNVYDLLIFSIPFAVVFTIFDLVVHRIFDPLCAKYYITTERYTEPEQKIKRSYTLVKWIYSIGYYILSSAWAYKIMIATTFMPTWLGGLGNPLTMIDNGPKILEATLQMKIFYIFQCGKHFSRFFSHVFIRSQGNFFQYALHHGLSVFLIVFSYLSNQWLIGIFVLLIHDYSDFALILARTYKDSKYMVKKILDVIYVHAFTAWVGCRIVLFSYCCIYSSVQFVLAASTRLTQFQYQVLIFPYAFMSFMMMGLQILHLFWTYYIAESFVAIKISPKLANHTYD